MIIRNMVLLLLFIICIHTTLAHVRLQYPAARYPALDFLDSARTDSPCGVPKPHSDIGTVLGTFLFTNFFLLAVRTTLFAGSQLNVSWFMSYPHQVFLIICNILFISTNRAVTILIY
jgi:hypothetical protein